MIKVDGKARTVRQCTAWYEYSKGGEIVSEQIAVRYFSDTVADLRERRLRLEQRAKEQPDEIIWISEMLVDRIESLPDLAGADGKPLKITVENLEQIDVPNLRAIQKAIDDDMAPKEQPSK